ncbi:MAG: phenylalanine--tRNA ligase subunit beta [Nanoarchaeota archaeon]|nr:phenylalanine--tRNA ligase subunit beta [Nanoarchaeota archaeon]
MTILTVPKKQFEKEVGNLTEEMQKQIAMFGTPVEELTDDELQIEIFPNRPDLLSYQNYKNAFLTYLGKKKPQKYKIRKSGVLFKVDKSVKDIRPYTMAAIVKNVKFTDEKIKEIMQFQEKLHLSVGRNRKKVAMGYYDLSKIKFPVRYIAKNPKDIFFEPLDMPQKMSALQILSRHPCGRDYGNQLEGFNKFPVYYDDNDEVLSLPPIINSNNSGKIVSGVSDVLIECSGTNQEILKKVISIAVVDLISCGGVAYSVGIDYGDKIELINLKPDKIKLSVENVNKLLGLNLKENEIKDLLGKMGHEYSKGIVNVPCQRTDVLHEVDLIEDIAIAYGYDNFIPEIPEVSTIGESDNKEIIKSRIAEILSGLGLLETSSFHLTTKDMQFKKLGRKAENFVEVKDSKTEYSILRQDLSHCLLKILSENVDVSYPQEIFQIGTVFEGYNETENLTIAIAPGNFTKLKQILEYLSRMLDVEFKIEIPENVPEHFIDGRVGEILFNGKSIGYFGEVHPKILNNFKIKLPVSLLEINIEEILKIN